MGNQLIFGGKSRLICFGLDRDKFPKLAVYVPRAIIRKLNLKAKEEVEYTMWRSETNSFRRKMLGLPDDPTQPPKKNEQPELTMEEREFMKLVKENNDKPDSYKMYVQQQGKKLFGTERAHYLFERAVREANEIHGTIPTN